MAIKYINAPKIIRTINVGFGGLLHKVNAEYYYSICHLERSLVIHLLGEHPDTNCPELEMTEL